MQEINLTLFVEEAIAILNVLGELPTKTGAYPLVVKLKEQLDSQVEQELPSEE
jgi:hypothetical protein